jgi:hypothetical protein
MLPNQEVYRERVIGEVEQVELEDVPAVVPLDDDSGQVD